jgi:hypothetical protein
LAVKLSKKALKFLAGIILGDSGLSPTLTEPELANFFENRSEWEPFGYGFPPRDEYVGDRLKVFNGSPRMQGFVEKAFQAEPDSDDAWVAKAAARFSVILAEDGYEMRLSQKPGFRHGLKYAPGQIYFALAPLGGQAQKAVTYSVTVIDNFHRDDPSENQVVRGFASEEEAMAYGLARVRSSIEQFRKPGDDHDAHYRKWMTMGEEVLVDGARLGAANFIRFHHEPATDVQCDWVTLTPPDPEN